VLVAAGVAGMRHALLADGGRVLVAAGIAGMGVPTAGVALHPGPRLRQRQSRGEHGGCRNQHRSHLTISLFQGRFGGCTGLGRGWAAPGGTNGMGCPLAALSDANVSGGMASPRCQSEYSV